MKPRALRRWGGWAVLGVASTAIVMAAPPGGDAGMARPISAMQKASTGAPASAMEKRTQSGAAHVELERLARLQLARGGDPPGAAGGGKKIIGDVFRTTSWYVPPPPPPPPPPAPPPPPSAPPLPFTYLGLYEDAPTRLIILVKGDRMYTVAEGDLIDETYRVERVTDGRVELTYLPLDIKQFIVTGGVP